MSEVDFPVIARQFLIGLRALHDKEYAEAFLRAVVKIGLCYGGEEVSQVDVCGARLRSHKNIICERPKEHEGHHTCTDLSAPGGAIQWEAESRIEELRAWDAYAAAALSNPTCMLGRNSRVTHIDGVGRSRSEWAAIEAAEAKQIPGRSTQIVAEIVADIALFADAMLAERRKR